MLERLAVTLALLGLGFLLGRLALRAGLERRARHGLMLPSYRLGRPAILYFTAPGCAPCGWHARMCIRTILSPTALRSSWAAWFWPVRRRLSSRRISASAGS